MTCYTCLHSIRRTVVTLLIAVVPIATPRIISARATTATLSGTVLDGTGAVVPEAGIAAIHVATGLQRRTRTTDAGTFVFPALPPGTYTLTAQRDGFTPVEVRDFVLNVGDDSGVAAAGKTVEVHLTVAMEPDWHVYGMKQAPGGPKPLVIRVADGQPFTISGAVVAPEPRREFDETFKLETEFYDERTTFRLPVTIAPGAPRGAQPLKISIRYQSCSPELCRPPVTETVTLDVTIPGSV